MAGPVIIGFDGTPVSEHAVAEGAALLAPRRALVVVVWEAGRAFNLAMVPSRALELTSTIDIRTAAAIEAAEAEAAEELAQWGALLATEAGLEAEGLAVADDITVADTLARIAKELDAEAIVVGSHRRGRLSELLLGSTSKGVIEKAPCPVVVVRGD